MRANYSRKVMVEGKGFEVVTHCRFNKIENG